MATFQRQQRHSICDPSAPLMNRGSTSSRYSIVIENDDLCGSMRFVDMVTAEKEEAEAATANTPSLEARFLLGRIPVAAVARGGVDAKSKNKSNRRRWSTSIDHVPRRRSSYGDLITDRQNTSKVRDLLIQDVASSRQQLHERLLKMDVGSDEWREMKQALSEQRSRISTFTNQGAIIGLQCHIVDQCRFKQQEQKKNWKQKEFGANNNHHVALKHPAKKDMVGTEEDKIHDKMATYNKALANSKHSTSSAMTRRPSAVPLKNHNSLRKHMIGQESLRCLQKHVKAIQEAEEAAAASEASNSRYSTMLAGFASNRMLFSNFFNTLSSTPGRDQQTDDESLYYYSNTKKPEEKRASSRMPCGGLMNSTKNLLTSSSSLFGNLSFSFNDDYNDNKVVADDHEEGEGQNQVGIMTRELGLTKSFRRSSDITTDSSKIVVAQEEKRSRGRRISCPKLFFNPIDSDGSSSSTTSNSTPSSSTPITTTALPYQQHEDSEEEDDDDGGLDVQGWMNKDNVE